MPWSRFYVYFSSKCWLLRTVWQDNSPHQPSTLAHMRFGPLNKGQCALLDAKHLKSSPNFWSPICCRTQQLHTCFLRSWPLIPAPHCLDAKDTWCVRYFFPPNFEHYEAISLLMLMIPLFRCGLSFDTGAFHTASHQIFTAAQKTWVIVSH